MVLIGIVVAAIIVFALVRFLYRRTTNRRELSRHCIDPETLHGLLESGAEVLVLDVRLPLDLLAYSEIIPGAVRLAPKEIQANPELIPRDKDAVVYCTCPGEETSLEVVHKARALGFERIKVLRGGLAGWKAKGLPVSPFTESFRLDTAS